METNISESISARLVSDKPIKKTPYQVKGVFMKQFSDEKIVPFLFAITDYWRIIYCNDGYGSIILINIFGGVLAQLF